MCSPMQGLKTRSEVALYVWDYFYCANVPAPGDDKPWRLIENATGRIHETEAYLDARFPASGSGAPGAFATPRAWRCGRSIASP